MSNSLKIDQKLNGIHKATSIAIFGIISDNVFHFTVLSAVGVELKLSLLGMAIRDRSCLPFSRSNWWMLSHLGCSVPISGYRPVLQDEGLEHQEISKYSLVLLH